MFSYPSTTTFSLALYCQPWTCRASLCISTGRLFSDPSIVFVSLDDDLLASAVLSALDLPSLSMYFDRPNIFISLDHGLLAIVAPPISTLSAILLISTVRSFHIPRRPASSRSCSVQTHGPWSGWAPCKNRQMLPFPICWGTVVHKYIPTVRVLLHGPVGESPDCI